MSGLRGETPKSPRDLTGRRFNELHAEEAANRKGPAERDPREYWDDEAMCWVIDYTVRHP
jgi:hypothetical protein